MLEKLPARSFENLSFTCLEGVHKSVVGSWKRKAETTCGTSAVQTCRDASYGFSLRLMTSDSGQTDMYSDIRTTVLSLLSFSNDGHQQTKGRDY